MSVRRSLIALLLVGTVAALAAPSTAGAGTITCQASVGGWFDPPMRDLNARSGGMSGTYTVVTSGLVNRSACVIHGHLGWFDSRITTRGTFVSTTCGNGVLTGDAVRGSTVLDLGLAGRPVVQMSYTIELRGWQGLLRVTRVNDGVEHGGDDIDGVVSLVPQHGCVNAGVETFTMDGAFSITW